jgi:hypothetical protein
MISFACYSWPIYTDSYNNSCRCLIFFKAKNCAVCLLLRSPFIHTVTCVLEVNMTFKLQF